MIVSINSAMSRKKSGIPESWSYHRIRTERAVICGCHSLMTAHSNSFLRIMVRRILTEIGRAGLKNFQGEIHDNKTS